jgi:hypothetical protein
MGLQKYRADECRVQGDGAEVWTARWFGGPSLSKIKNCRWESLEGEPRVTVYITGDPDTWFSIPAATMYKGCVVKGYVTSNDYGNYVFRHQYDG